VEQTAELTGLVRTLAIIFTVYWGFRLFSRYVLPWLLKRLALFVGKKVQDNMRSQGFNQQGFGGEYEEPVSGNEKVTIKKTQQQKSGTKSMDDVGEYVDFEEVE